MHRAQDERTRWGWRLLSLFLVLAGTQAEANGADRACVPWPGEIDPLPTIFDPDPFAARWARLRAAELARLATALEAEEPSEAYRIWVHTECLAPESSAAGRAQELLPGFVVASRPPARPTPRRAQGQRERVPRPRVVATPEPPPARGKSNASPKPPGVAAAAPPRPRPEGAASEPPAAAPPAARRDFVQVDAQLAEAAESLRRARFREVLQTTDRLRSELESWPAGSEVQARRVRIEVLDASALVALRLPDRAAESFARALQVDPELVLDPATTSPKIRRLLEQVRKAQREGEL